MRTPWISRCAAILLGLTAGGFQMQAAPAHIIFLRHGEKPATGPDLNERGKERAKALIAFFKSDARITSLGPIAAIFAAKPQQESGSMRSIETMEPTSRTLGIPLLAEIKRDDYRVLVSALMDDQKWEDKTVVVCWEHKKIPEMLKELGWLTGPEYWDDAVFDRFWTMDFMGGRPIRVKDLPQTLLPGDATK